MPLYLWNEIRGRAIRFGREWKTKSQPTFAA